MLVENKNSLCPEKRPKWKWRNSIWKVNFCAKTTLFYTKKTKITKAIFRFVHRTLRASSPWLQRKNKHLLHQSDAHILAIHLLGKGLGFSSERAWHRFVQGNICSIVERSRYHRRCRDMRVALKWLWIRLIQAEPTEAYTLMDSLPLSLCHPIRLSLARILRKSLISDIAPQKRVATVDANFICKSVRVDWF